MWQLRAEETENQMQSKANYIKNKLFIQKNITPNINQICIKNIATNVNHIC